MASCSVPVELANKPNGLVRRSILKRKTPRGLYLEFSNEWCLPRSTRVELDRRRILFSHDATNIEFFLRTRRGVYNFSYVHTGVMCTNQRPVFELLKQGSRFCIRKGNPWPNQDQRRIGFEMLYSNARSQTRSVGTRLRTLKRFQRCAL